MHVKLQKGLFRNTNKLFLSIYEGLDGVYWLENNAHF